MHTLRIAIVVVWVCFWVYWLWQATRANASRPGGRAIRVRLAIWICIWVVFRVFHPHGLEIHSIVIAAIGTAIFLSGLGLAVWARVHLGRNWGMPMTQRQEPELVTSGPYRLIRHPIYTGLILGVAGTALAFNLIGLLLALLVAVLCYFGARVEEGNMTAAFPTTYPAYRTRTKMLIPFVL